MTIAVDLGRKENKQTKGLSAVCDCVVFLDHTHLLFWGLCLLSHVVMFTFLLTL